MLAATSNQGLDHAAAAPTKTTETPQYGKRHGDNETSACTQQLAQLKRPK